MDLSSLRVCYFYKRAKQYNQIMSFDDLMRMYSSMIYIKSKYDANFLWQIIFYNINNKTFDSFSELNQTIINSIHQSRNQPKLASLCGKRKRNSIV